MCAGPLAAVDALVDDVMAAELSASEHVKRLQNMKRTSSFSGKINLNNLPPSPETARPTTHPT